jgi:hypothetical protein
VSFRQCALAAAPTKRKKRTAISRLCMSVGKFVGKLGIFF